MLIKELEIRTAYDSAAKIYDKRAWAKFWRKNEKPIILNVIKDLIGEQKGKKILDVGCGTGMYKQSLVSHFFEYHGVDISQKSICIAKKNQLNGTYNGKHPSFTIGSTFHLPFKNKTFDFLIASKIISHYKNYQAAFSELLRVLKNKGYLILCDVHSLHDKTYAIFKTDQGEIISKVKNYLRDPVQDIDFFIENRCQLIYHQILNAENSLWRAPQNGPLANIWENPTTPILYIIVVQK